MQLGTTEDRGLYSKPLAAVHPVALAARSVPQYNTTLNLSLDFNILTPIINIFIPVLSIYTISS